MLGKKEDTGRIVSVRVEKDGVDERNNNNNTYKWNW